ncbi:hypothetical protein F7P82_06425 [Acinetobacter guillouiae]|nr:hypothetical protein F7P82_06425 [Acinetobacter guillouiae]
MMKIISINPFMLFALFNHIWCVCRVATWMSPLGGGIGCTPRQTKDFCHFLSLKSEALPTRRYLNFQGKMWHCKPHSTIN